MHSAHETRLSAAMAKCAAAVVVGKQIPHSKALAAPLGSVPYGGSRSAVNGSVI
jgi:hypothetical protein